MFLSMSLHTYTHMYIYISLSLSLIRMCIYVYMHLCMNICARSGLLIICFWDAHAVVDVCMDV